MKTLPEVIQLRAEDGTKVNLWTSKGDPAADIILAYCQTHKSVSPPDALRVLVKIGELCARRMGTYNLEAIAAAFEAWGGDVRIQVTVAQRGSTKVLPLGGKVGKPKQTKPKKGERATGIEPA